MFMSKYSPQLINAIFLVAGTCIGGGMLALPVATCQAGFFPSLAIMIIAWLAMTMTALYLVEAGFWMKKSDAHLISMTSQLIGKKAKALSWTLYLFICYASLVAYTAGAGHLMSKAVSASFAIECSKTAGCVLFMAFFGPAIFLSHKALGKINSALFLTMIAAYLLIVGCGLGEVKSVLLMREKWSVSYLALPLLLTSFSFQTMVPSLHPYLNHHIPSLRLAVVGGTLLAFLVYVLWQLVVLGTIPFEGANGLGEALQKGEAATHYFSAHIQNPIIEWAACFFSFFALVTSFFGISLGLFDFLSDGLKMKKKGLDALKLGALIVFPSLFFAIYYEQIFILALDASGGFGDTILNGLIPITMVWIGRYILKKESPEGVSFGGKKELVFLFLFYLTALFVEIFMRTGHLASITDI
jgi:tyrosine-specific transport protein